MDYIQEPDSLVFTWPTCALYDSQRLAAANVHEEVAAPAACERAAADIYTWGVRWWDYCCRIGRRCPVYCDVFGGKPAMPGRCAWQGGVVVRGHMFSLMHTRVALICKHRHIFGATKQYIVVYSWASPPFHVLQILSILFYCLFKTETYLLKLQTKSALNMFIMRKRKINHIGKT